MTTNIYPTATAGAPSEVLWSWDGLTTTQFDGTQSFDDFPLAGATTLTVVADGGIGNLLRFRTTKAGGGVRSCAIRLITQTFPKVSLNQYRYVLRARFVSTTGTGAAQAFGGWAFLANAGPGAAQFAFVSGVGDPAFAATNGRVRIEAGVLVTNGTVASVSPPVPPGDAIIEIEIVAHHNADLPDWTQALRSTAPAAGDLGDSYRLGAIDPGTPLPAAWGAQTLDRIGLALYQEAGAVGTGMVTLDIADLAVLRYPTDR